MSGKGIIPPFMSTSMSEKELEELYNLLHSLLVSLDERVYKFDTRALKLAGATIMLLDYCICSTEIKPHGYALSPVDEYEFDEEINLLLEERHGLKKGNENE